MKFSFKKSQIAMEFMLLSGIALIAAIVFVSISLDQIKGLYAAKESLLAKDVALKIQSEISIASNAEDGYSRDFELPEKINNRDYNISIINNTLAVWTTATPYVIGILDAEGNLEKGSNAIRKTNGVIYIN